MAGPEKFYGHIVQKLFPLGATLQQKRKQNIIYYHKKYNKNYKNNTQGIQFALKT